MTPLVLCGRHLLTLVKAHPLGTVNLAPGNQTIVNRVSICDVFYSQQAVYLIGEPNVGIARYPYPGFFAIADDDDIRVIAPDIQIARVPQIKARDAGYF